MMKEVWVTAALTNDVLVAELLLRLKQSSSSDSSHAPPQTAATLIPPIGWGHRKSRSKPSTTTAAAAANGFSKEHQSGSPTTPLCWSGCATSTSDGYDEFARPSDLSSGSRSTKVALTNESATTSSYNNSRKRKSFDELKEEEGFLLKERVNLNTSFDELKEEEGFLLKERVNLNTDLTSMRVTLNQQMATSDNLKRFKNDLHQKPEKVMLLEHEPWIRSKVVALTMVNQSVQMSCRAEPDIKTPSRGFVLPDLNMTPVEDEPTTMMSQRQQN